MYTYIYQVPLYSYIHIRNEYGIINVGIMCGPPLHSIVLKYCQLFVLKFLTISICRAVWCVLKLFHKAQAHYFKILVVIASASFGIGNFTKPFTTYMYVFCKTNIQICSSTIDILTGYIFFNKNLQQTFNNNANEAKVVRCGI